MSAKKYPRIRRYSFVPGEEKVFNSFSGFLMVYVKAGAGTFCINDRLEEFKSGTVSVMSCLDYLKLKDSENPVELWTLEFSEEAFSGRIPEFFSIRKLPVITNAGTESKKLEDILELMEMGIDNKLEKTDIFLRNLSKAVLIYTVKFCNTDGQKTVFDRKTEQAILYIYMHFKESLSIEEVSAHVHYSANYFYHSFQKNTGTSFQKFLYNLRMDYARNLMRFTDLSVSDICYECGYNSVQYFSTAFRKKFGQSPKNYINENLRTGGKL